MDTQEQQALPAYTAEEERYVIRNKAGVPVGVRPHHTWTPRSIATWVVITALGVLGQQGLEGGGIQKRDVPAGNDDGPGQVLGQMGQPAGHGPPGAGDLVLVGRDGVGGDLGEVGDDGVALVTHNDDEVLGLEPPGCGDGVVHEAATADPVQDLGGDRSHTSSLACGHDDDGGGCG